MLEQGAVDMGVAPELLPGQASYADEAARAKVAAAWNVTLPAGTGAPLMEMLERCRRLCVARDLPLIILGPTPVGLSPWRSRLCGRMNRALQQRVPELGLPLACIEGLTDDAGRPLLKADGFHMTAQGHAYVADRLREPLAAWARSCLAKGANSRPPQSDSSLQYRGSAEKNLA